MIVALYARVSTTKQAERDLSIPDQLRQMREWCKARQYEIALEYTEPGASATDGRRPVFQQMIAEACTSPPPFDAIIVHSLSRFFRDMIEFGLCERQLKKHGVVVLSMTQQTSNDPTGEMVRRIFSLFDEYQSKENGKHTLRAMNENARQGYHNGSTPPYGYRAVEMGIQGNKGKKKKLEVEQAESTLVSKIFQLYLYGHQGQQLGARGIAAYCNDRGITFRGKRWHKSAVHDILNNRTYLGEFIFNRKEAKTGRIKPESEWITVNVEPIIDPELFEQVRQKLESRSPDKIPPRVVSSPTLLTGIVRCGSCGASMTIATGKGGRYRYYKCSRKINDLAKDQRCQNTNVPMEKLDGLILRTVAERIFTPERVELMLKELEINLKHAHSDQHEQIRQLNKEIDAIKEQMDKLYEAVEKGFLPLNSSLQERVQKHETRRDEILAELASLKRQKEMPVEKLGKKHIAAFCSALKERLCDKASNFGKEYLKLLVKEIRVDKKEVHLSGSYSALASALSISTKPAHAMVPSFVPNWLPNPDSNQGQGG